MQLKKLIQAEAYRYSNFMPNLYRVQEVICLQVTKCCPIINKFEVQRIEQPSSKGDLRRSLYFI
jgi:hypothetical protein